MTEAAGSGDATEEESVSVVPVIGATVEGPGTCKYGGVGEGSRWRTRGGVNSLF